MARDYIKIDDTQSAATQAGALKSYVNALRNAYDQGTRLKAIMDHNTDSTVYTDIEILFGIPTGKGSATYTLLSNSLTAGAKAFTEQVG